MLINVKMPTIVGILTFMSMINFMLSSVEHEKSYYNLEAWCLKEEVPSLGRRRFCQALFSFFCFSKNVSDLGFYHLSATEDNWSLILESPSNIVSNVSFESSTFTLELSGTTLV